MAVGGAVWVVLVSLGFFLLVHYSATPGEAADAPPEWPSDAEVPLYDEGYTLVMVVHPHCSCTRASVAELAELMTDHEGRIRGHVLFARPEGFDEEWERTDLWDSASLIADIEVWDDELGRRAEKFGAKTSGQTYLYDPSGRLRFAGGITPSRSHQGNSLGRERIDSIVTTGEASGSESAVYGCGVDDERAEDKSLFQLSSLF